MSNTWQKVKCSMCDGGVFFYSRAAQYIAGDYPCYQDCVMPWLEKSSTEDRVKCSSCGSEQPFVEDIEPVTDPVMIRVLDSVIGE